MKKILVLTDFSLPSEAAVSFAFQLAQLGTCSVYIYHCMTEHTHVRFNLKVTDSYSIFDVTDAKKISAFKNWRAMADTQNADAYFITGGGDLVEGTNSFCLENNIDLVIMGSTGRSRKTVQWGSNTDEMVKKINYPLLIIKEKVDKIAFKKVIYASSFTLKDKKSFQLFLKLIPFDKGAEINLVSIDTESFFSQPSILMQQSMDDYVAMADPILTRKNFVQSYNVKSGIRQFSTSLNPDLVVMSNKVRKPIKRILMGNDAVGIAHTSPYPVMIINYPD